MIKIRFKFLQLLLSLPGSAFAITSMGSSKVLKENGLSPGLANTSKLFSAFRSEPLNRVRKMSEVQSNSDMLPTPALFLSTSHWQTAGKTLSNDEISPFLALLFLFAFVHFSQTFCGLLR